jgi:yersiniabactin synthetase, thiazolinyl reductase component
MSTTQKKRLLIAGAKFGEIYLNAFLRDQPDFELAGLLAKGSQRAQQLAKAFAIPLFTSVEQVPDTIDIACVVVRSTVVGGMGSTLAKSLLERGIHVVQEHPLHPDDITLLQQVAEQHHCNYWVNSFYPFTPAGHCWIESAHRVSGRVGAQQGCFAQLTTSRQLLYSALDLLLQATGAQQATAELLNTDDDAFHLLRVALPGCSALLRLQTYLDPQEPDFHSLVMHNISLGWPSGYLTLEASYGPVVWSSALYDPGHHQRASSLYTTLQNDRQSYLRQAPSLQLHAGPQGWSDAFEVDGPAGVAHVLQSLRRHLDGEPAPAPFQPDYQRMLARLWQQILLLAGPAREQPCAPPPFIDPCYLIAPVSEPMSA